MDTSINLTPTVGLCQTPQYSGTSILQRIPNQVLGIRNNFLCPSNSIKMYERELREEETSLLRTNFVLVP